MTWWQQVWALVLERAPAIIGIILGALLAGLLVRRAVARLGARLQGTGEGRRRTLTLMSVLGNVAKYAIFVIAAIMVLDRLGADTKSLLLGAGLVGLAISFGTQSLVRDLVTGFFIIFENQYAVGDLVDINGALGTVEEVGLRVTKLRALTGEVRFLPNGAIGSVANYTEGGVPYLLTLPRAVPPAALEAALGKFELRYQGFLRPPQLPAAGDGEELLSARLWVAPNRQALVEGNLAGYLCRELAGEQVALAPEQVVLVPAITRPPQKPAS